MAETSAHIPFTDILVILLCIGLYGYSSKLMKGLSGIGLIAGESIQWLRLFFGLSYLVFFPFYLFNNYPFPYIGLYYVGIYLIYFIGKRISFLNEDDQTEFELKTLAAYLFSLALLVYEIFALNIFIIN